MTSEEIQLRADESVERASIISMRAIQIVAACLAVVVLILVVFIASVISLASSAQDDADAVAAENERLSIELQCRSEIASSFAIADADLSILIAEGLTLVSEGTALGPIVPELTEAIAGLSEAKVARESAVEVCSPPDD